MSYLPENYRNSPETVAFQRALQPEMDGLWLARDDFLVQLNPCTATWGLDLWEDALGLPPSGAMALELRRQQVVAKLQGRGTTTVELLKNVGETLLGVPVSVIEVFDEYRVELVAEGRLLPLNSGVKELRERLLEILPAHLDFQLVIPMAVLAPVHARIGARLGVTTLPVRRCAPPAAAKLPAAVRPGWRVSIASLPARAGEPLPGQIQEVLN